MLAHLRETDYEVRDADMERLSSLGFEHVALAEPLARGELRPLRDPTAVEE